MGEICAPFKPVSRTEGGFVWSSGISASQPRFGCAGNQPRSNNNKNVLRLLVYFRISAHLGAHPMSMLIPVIGLTIVHGTGLHSLSATPYIIAGTTFSPASAIPARATRASTCPDAPHSRCSSGPTSTSRGCSSARFAALSCRLLLAASMATDHAPPTADRAGLEAVELVHEHEFGNIFYVSCTLTERA